MLTFLISFLLSFAVNALCRSNGLGSGATTTWSIVAFVLTMFIINLLIRRKVQGLQGQMQSVMAEGQKALQRKVHQFQTKPGGNPRMIQRQIEQDQAKLLRQALDFVPNFKPLQKWNLMMGRQIDTMRFQFHYQLKEFDEADAVLASRGFLSGPMMTEPAIVAMKMARDFKNDRIEAAEKSYRKGLRWFRGDRATLLYGLMSWIYLQKGDLDAAQTVLVKGKDKTTSEVLVRNWEALSNRDEKKFSNAGLGEEWYALYLQDPPMPKQKRARGKGVGPMY